MTASSLTALISLLDRANDLKRLPRAGWLLAGVAAAESVAEHTCATALLAWMLAAAVNEKPAAEGLAAPLDMERVLGMALVHDLAESVLTDLPRRATALLGESAKHAAEAEAMAAMTAGLPGGTAAAALWEEYAEGQTAEARLVKDADKLEMVHQAGRYTRGGQGGLAEFWEGHRFHYAASKALFAALRERDGA